MSIDVVSLYDLEQGARDFLLGLCREGTVCILTAERRPQLVLLPYDRFRALAEQLADLGEVLRELLATVAEAEKQHPYHELKESLIAEGVLDAG